MKIEQRDFKSMVNQAVGGSANRHLRPVIEKELLHYDIFFCLRQAGLLDGLVFQGGTCLRLCYGSQRLSEDLDFAGGADYSAHNAEQITECIEGYIGARYGLETLVKGPAKGPKTPSEKQRGDAVRVYQWELRVTTEPAHTRLPKQRVKVEVASVPAHAPQLAHLRANYGGLPDGYGGMLVQAEPLDEIMADKLLSLPVSSRERRKDVWDLAWLQQQGAAPQPTLVQQKIRDYRIEFPEYMARLQRRAGTIAEIVHAPRFTQEMRRFLPPEVAAETLEVDGFLGYLERACRKLLDDLQRELSSNPPPAP